MDSPPVFKNPHLEAAKMYASYGWKVFPLRPRDKRPVSLHGFHDATLDLGLIERWWAGLPEAGIGIATGAESGIIVLDIDPRNGGDESLAAVRAQYEKWADTAEALTGGGGKHYYFKHPGGILPSAKPWPGIDIKSDGGYVAASPSIHPTGLKYIWAARKDPGTCPPQPAPKWLVALLTDRKKKLAQQAEKDPAPEGASMGFIQEGGRNDGMASLAGTMQRRGMSPGAILAALKVENEARCRPPLGEGELWAIVNSIIRYEPSEGEVVQGNAATPGFEMGDGACAINGDIPEIHWLLEGWLARGDCSMLIGPPAIGKSWLSLEMAVAGAAGRDIFGHFDVNPMKTLLIDEENKHEELIRRIWSLGRAHGLKAEEIQERFFFTVPSQGISFRHRGHGAKLRELVATVRPDLIILDSLIAISNIADENSATMVRKFFHDELYPLRKICNSAILTIHHTNKQVYQYDPQSQGSGFVRGSIDMLAAPDSAMLLSPSGKAMVLEALKVRAGPNPQPLRVRLVDGTEGGIRPLVMQKVEAVEAGQKTLTATIQDTILMQLAAEPLTGPELMDRVLAALPEKVSLSYFRTVLQRMRTAGLIESKRFPGGTNERKYQIVKYQA